MGSGIVIDGSLFRGTSWVAGELAYVPFRPQDGVDCPLGRGCVEAYASASGVIREFSNVATSLQSDWYKALLVRGNITLRDVKLAHKRGEPSAAEAIQTCGEALGTAIGIALNLLGPTTIAIGGSVVELIPALFDTAKKAASVIGLPVAIAGCEIRQANWKDLDAVLLGAAALAATDARTLASYEIARD
jgi:glucokinase